MTKYYQETSDRKWVERPALPKRKLAWGGHPPHYAAASPFPTPYEIRHHEVDWERLRLMVQAYRRVRAGEDPQTVANDIRLQNRLPEFKTYKR